MAETSDNETTPITIKKYANRRLYNTATSSYVTMDHLAQMVKDGTDFIVYDAKTGEDITRSVLTHIIVEEESKGQNLLPINFLRHLISFYGDSLQTLVPKYLDYSMGSFARNQEQMRNYMQDALGGLAPFNQFEEMSKQNMAMFENAMQMFTPFKSKGGGPTDSGAGGGSNEKSGRDTNAGASGASDKQIDELRAKLESMQKQLDGLSDNS
ncbi:MAG: polyhydroxyalkanoate synthesis repressor PhaR [Rhodospirillales bacterium]|nr:polyhydroxyalkanoate synthesis repressor PhaR [Rhodospirillales bacterium]